jgi:hypothetical protein
MHLSDDGLWGMGKAHPPGRDGDDYIFNEKIGIDRLKYKGERMLEDWGWI